MHTYQAMIRHDQIEIVVVGDVTEEQVRPLAEQLGFSARPQPSFALSYRQAEAPVRQQTVKAHVNQAKLNLAYTAPVICMAVSIMRTW